MLVSTFVNRTNSLAFFGSSFGSLDPPRLDSGLAGTGFPTNATFCCLINFHTIRFEVLGNPSLPLDLALEDLT